MLSNSSVTHTIIDLMKKPDKRPLVLSGASGCGKSTLLKKLFAEFPNDFGFSISHTTRKPRAGETDGKEYHFVTRDQFMSDVTAGKFIEHAKFGGNIYGTSFAAVEAVAEQHRICILDIERQGVESIKKCPDMDAYFVYIKPPSIAVLLERLKKRGTETEETINARMECVERDMEYAERPGSYDKIIINDNLEVAYGELKEFVKKNYGL